MSTVTAPSHELTPAGVLDMPERDRFELVDGRLVELAMSSMSQYFTTRLARFLGNHCDPLGQAHVIVECGIVCFPGKPNQMRRPDICCVRTDRLAFDQIGEGFLTVRPDVVVEVISPNDRVDELEEKLDDYRDAGIPLVWLIYPPQRRVRIIRPVGPPTDLGPADQLTGEEILPGFHCQVAELFAAPPGSAIV